MYLFEIPLHITTTLVLAIPIVSIVFILTLTLLRGRTESSRLNWFIEKIVTPPTLKIEVNQTSEEPSPTEPNSISKRSVLTILVFVYLGIILFVIGNMTGVFYTVMADVTEAVSQGSTDLSRTISGIAFLDPFNAGWTGSLPWYGYLPLPLSEVDTYHDTWEWIYFTGVLWNNPDFFNNMLNEVIVFNFFMGLVFLLPLLYGPIRRSFLPSLYLFTTGMFVASTALLRCFAQVLTLGYMGGTIQYGLLDLSLANVDPEAVPIIVSALAPYVLLFAVIFPLLGYKMWRGLYPDNRKSAVLFALYILGSYFLTFLIALW
ncbi:MAG: hypothetical protein KAR33_08565 [Candidatus Thorarchaeota archaeon]|nr:hypothetical protein [Candidatus Thorarchaeota archaeon]